MQLSENQLSSFNENGFLIVEDCLSTAEVDALKSELPHLAERDTLRWVEENSGDVRTLYVPYTKSKPFNNLARLPKLLQAAEQIVDSQVYIHSYTLHPKVALKGEGFEWHQDYWFAHKEDMVPRPQMVFAQVFLDDVNSDLSGPIVLMPGSHKHTIELDPYYKNYQRPQSELVPSGRRSSEKWGFSMSVDQKYRVSAEQVSELVDQHGMLSLKGKPGTVAFLHINIMHASSNNITPWDRKMLRIVYNSVNNIPLEPENLRPEPVIWSDFTPLTPVAENALLAEEVLAPAT